MTEIYEYDWRIYRNSWTFSLVFSPGGSGLRGIFLEKTRGNPGQL